MATHIALPMPRAMNLLVGEFLRWNIAWPVLSLMWAAALVPSYNLFIPPYGVEEAGLSWYIGVTAVAFWMLSWLMTSSVSQRKAALFASAPVSEFQWVLGLWLTSASLTISCAPIGYGLTLYLGHSLPPVWMYLAASLLGTVLTAVCHAIIIVPSLWVFRGILRFFFIIGLVTVGCIVAYYIVLASARRFDCALKVLAASSTIALLYLREHLALSKRPLCRELVNYPPIARCMLALPLLVAFAFIMAADYWNKKYILIVLLGFPLLMSTSIDRRWLRLVPILPVTPLSLLLRFLLPGVVCFLASSVFVAIVSFSGHLTFGWISVPFACACAGALFASSFARVSARFTGYFIEIPLALVFIQIWLIARTNGAVAMRVYATMAGLAVILAATGTFRVWRKLKERRLFI